MNQESNHQVEAEKKRSAMPKASSKQTPLINRDEEGYGGVTSKQPYNRKTEDSPWLTEDGTFKSDKEISELGKSWSSATWNKYLNASVGTVKDKNLALFKNMDTEIAYEGAEFLKSLREAEKYPDLFESLNEALNLISPRERQVIKLRFWEGKTQKEISQELGIKVNTVKVLRLRGLKKLKEILPSKEFKDHLELKKNKRIESEFGGRNPICNPVGPY